MKPQSPTIGLNCFLVVVEAINGDLAITMDKFGQRREVRTDVMRTNRRPAVGENWVIDRSLGHWTFAAVMGGAGGGGSASLVGPIFSYPGALSSAVSGLYVFPQAMALTKITVSVVMTTHTELIVKLYKGNADGEPDPWYVFSLPVNTLVRVIDLTDVADDPFFEGDVPAGYFDFEAGDTIFVTGTSFSSPRPFNVTIQTEAVAS